MKVVIVLVVMMILAAEANVTTEKAAGKKGKSFTGKKVDEGKGKGKTVKEERQEVSKGKDVMEDVGIIGHLHHHDCGIDHPHNESEHFAGYEFSRDEDLEAIYSETLRLLREDEQKRKELEGQSTSDSADRFDESGLDKGEHESEGHESNDLEDKEKHLEPQVGNSSQEVDLPELAKDNREIHEAHSNFKHLVVENNNLDSNLEINSSITSTSRAETNDANHDAGVKIFQAVPLNKENFDLINDLTFENSELLDENKESSFDTQSDNTEPTNTFENHQILKENPSLLNETQEPDLETIEDSMITNQEVIEDEDPIENNDELYVNSNIHTSHQNYISESQDTINYSVIEPQNPQQYTFESTGSENPEPQAPISTSTPESPKMFYDSILALMISFAESVESLFIGFYKEIRSHETYKLTAFYSALLLVIYLFYPSPSSTTFKVTISNDNSGVQRLEKLIDEEYGKIKKLVDQKQGEPKQESSESLMLKKIFEDLENIKELEANFQVQVIDAHQEIWKAIDKRNTPLSPPRTIKILVPEE